jgi:hypothetical protein
MREDYRSPQKSNKDDGQLLFLQIPLVLVSGVGCQKEAKCTSDRWTAGAYSGQCRCSCAMLKDDTEVGEPSMETHQGRQECLFMREVAVA